MRRGLATQLAAWSVPLFAETAALARSVLIARALGAEELGRTMVLALVLRLAEMLADAGIERFLMARPGPMDRDMMAALHGAALVRGLVTAVFLLALAAPATAVLAGAAGVGTHVALALVPLTRGGVHLGYRLEERERHLRPYVLVEGGAVLVMLASVLPALAVFGDHRAMVAILLAQALTQVLLSHMVARNPWRARLDRSVLGEVLGFGGPLILNAVLMFATFQADRMIVAGWYGWAEVALYGVAFQMAMLPAQIAGRAAGSLLGPRLRGATGPELNAVARATVALHLLAALGFALAFALLAPPMIAALWGAAFQPGGTLALLLGLAAGGRILRTPLSLIAVMLGRTAEPARANLWRAAALAPSCLAAAWGLPLEAVAASAALGEAAASLFALFRARDLLWPRRAPAL